MRELMRRVERKIDVLVDGEKKRVEVEGPLDVMTLLALPDFLRKSALAIVKLGKAMAEDVAKETGRTRAIESMYLNQLVRLGHLKKVKEWKRVYFWADAAPTGAEP